MTLPDGPDRRTIGQRIKTARRNANLTQKALATKLKVTARAISQWEAGKVPAITKLPALAATLNVSLDWLLAQSSDPKPSPRLSNPLDQDLQLLKRARQLGVNLHQFVTEARQQRWIQENRGALADASAFLDRHGLWSDGKRQF